MTIAELLVVDPEVTEESPSLRSLLLARPLLEREGIRFRFLAQRCGLRGQNAWHRVPGANLPSFLRTWLFLLYVHLWGWRHRGSKAPTVVLANDGMCLWADIVVFHFFNPAWLRVERTIARREWRDHASRLRSWQGWLQDVMQVRFGRWRFLNAVSESLLDEIRPLAAGRSGSLGVLPNAVPNARFSPSRRLLLRAEARRRFGYEPPENVFLFVSQGHYRRKGFWLAVEAVAIARKRGFHGARFHVVGGHPATLQRIEGRLGRDYPNWRQWLHLTGMVSDPEIHFALADALLFPSHFEALSLVEIEAAAMGLPLLLTPHHGSEMVLKDKVNGRLIPFDPDGIANVLVEVIEQGCPPAPRELVRALCTEDFAARLHGQIQNVIAKFGDSGPHEAHTDSRFKTLKR
jgi:glycosyltransferase involved in cell wall biosynthesis